MIGLAVLGSGVTLLILGLDSRSSWSRGGSAATLVVATAVGAVNSGRTAVTFGYRIFGGAENSLGKNQAPPRRA